MEFWKMAFGMGCVNEDRLRKVVITETWKYGYITKDEFKLITNKDFDVVVSPVDPPVINPTPVTPQPTTTV